MSDIVYLDNAATMPVRPEVLEAMLPYLKENFANPSSIHPAGQEVRLAIERARGQVAGLIGAEPAEVVFTSGATEANNLAIRGVLEPMLDRGEKPHAVTTSLEHPSVAETFKALAKRGLDLTVVDPDKNGVVSAQEVLAVVRPDTALVSVMMVNNELGTIQPVEDITRGLRASKSKALFHIDAVQAPIAVDIDVKKSGTDLLSLSAHKLGGPKGVGALFIRKGTKLEPSFSGGKQETGFRSGTENVAGIIGFGVAAGSLKSLNVSGRTKTSAFKKMLLERLAATGIAKPLFENNATHIIPIEVPGTEADFLVLLLGRAGVMISAGSACSSGSREASPVHAAIGLPEARAKSVLRVSLGYQNTEQDIAAFVEALGAAIKKARP
jgi:cysteine desulfurase